jgi:hypothetical protein
MANAAAPTYLRTPRTTVLLEGATRMVSADSQAVVATCSVNDSTLSTQVMRWERTPSTTPGRMVGALETSSSPKKTRRRTRKAEWSCAATMGEG